LSGKDLINLPDEYYPLEVGEFNLTILSEVNRAKNCRKFADTWFNDEPDFIISDDEIRELYRKIEINNHHLEKEDGTIVTCEQLLAMTPAENCLLFLVPNEPIMR